MPQDGKKNRTRFLFFIFCFFLNCARKRAFASVWARNRCAAALLPPACWALGLPGCRRSPGVPAARRSHVHPSRPLHPRAWPLHACAAAQLALACLSAGPCMLGAEAPWRRTRTGPVRTPHCRRPLGMTSWPIPVDALIRKSRKITVSSSWRYTLVIL